MNRNTSKFLTSVLEAESEGNDLYDSGDGFIHVLTKNEDSYYSIGSVDKQLFHIDPHIFWRAVDQIKFGFVDK